MNKISLYFTLSLLFGVFCFASAQEKPSIRNVDRIRLSEAFKIGENLGDQIWKNWTKAPFAVLLVTPENEFLIRHPEPSKDFALIGYDKLLKSAVYWRKRTQSPQLLATFPLEGVPTIIIGQAENTEAKTSTPWVVTVLHEHFHQLQYSQPNYYRDVSALNLSGSDQTGMWMLNYAFPYRDAKVKQQFESLSRQLADILQTKNKADFKTKLAVYLDARRQLQKTLGADDDKYFSFQLWQEGIARYTEYQVALLAAKKHRPSREFRTLKDFKSFQTVADELLNSILKELAALDLSASERVAFYPLGAGEAVMLDRINPTWKDSYFENKFFLEKYFEK